MVEEGDKTLDELMDDTAIAIAENLLEKALASEGSFVDLAKSFEILAKYADGRAAKRDANQPKPKGKLDGLRDRFHGHTTPGRGAPRKAKAETEDGGIAHPGPGTAPAAA